MERSRIATDETLEFKMPWVTNLTAGDDPHDALLTPLSTKMPNELTRLLKVAPRRPRTTWVAPDLACAALCAILKLLSYQLKYIILFCHPSRGYLVFFLILYETFDSVVFILWGEVVLSVEAAVFKGAHAASLDSERSEEATKAGIKANQKATSIPVTFQACLELIDQNVTTFVAFSKVGCH